ncbi:S1 family peptidase [Aeromonas veronii]
MMDVFTQIVVTIGRVSPQGVAMLGTGFLVRSDGLIVTPRHVIGDNDQGLVVLVPHIHSFSQYQDTSNNQCHLTDAKIKEIDPMRDLAIIKINNHFSGIFPSISGFDHVNVAEKIEIYGYPHCVEGRRVLTYQSAEIGSKILIESNGIKSKFAVINTQSRPGQSGSLIFSPRLNSIVGILIGAYVPDGVGVSVAGINPHELNQTTQCISSEYILEMI